MTPIEEGGKEGGRKEGGKEGWKEEGGNKESNNKCHHMLGLCWH